jgi:hypothetical protein
MAQFLECGLSETAEFSLFVLADEFAGFACLKIFLMLG